MVNILYVEGGNNRTVKILADLMRDGKHKSKEPTATRRPSSADELLAEAVSAAKARNPNAPSLRIRYIQVGNDEELFNAVRETAPEAIDPLYDVPFGNVIGGKRAE